MKTVYHLRNNHRYINDVQYASLHRNDAGLRITHGLFGSREWWKNIELGNLPLITLKGVIEQVYMSGHNDWPEFELITEDGKKSQWTRKVDEKEFDACYQPGRKVELDYVIQQFKRSHGTGLESPCVVEIRIGDSVKCNERSP